MDRTNRDRNLVSNPIESSGANVPDRRPSSFKVVSLAIVGALLFAGVMIWRSVVYQASPQCALDKFFAATREKNYETIYSMVQVPPAVELMLPNAAALRRMAEKVPALVPVVEDVHYGATTLEGDDLATVETTTTSRTANKSSTTSASVRMVRVSGQWKIDGKWLFDEMMRRGGMDVLKLLQ